MIWANEARWVCSDYSSIDCHWATRRPPNSADTYAMNWHTNLTAAAGRRRRQQRPPQPLYLTELNLAWTNWQALASWSRTTTRSLTTTAHWHWCYCYSNCFPSCWGASRATPAAADADDARRSGTSWRTDRARHRGRDCASPHRTPRSRHSPRGHDWDWCGKCLDSSWMNDAGDRRPQSTRSRETTVRRPLDRHKRHWRHRTAAAVDCRRLQSLGCRQTLVPCCWCSRNRPSIVRASRSWPDCGADNKRPPPQPPLHYYSLYTPVGWTTGDRPALRNEYDRLLLRLLSSRLPGWPCRVLLSSQWLKCSSRMTNRGWNNKHNVLLLLLLLLFQIVLFVFCFVCNLISQNFVRF